MYSVGIFSLITMSCNLTLFFDIIVFLFTLFSMTISFSWHFRLHETAIRLGELQAQFKLPIDPKEYAQENLKFGLVEVVYEWAKVLSLSHSHTHTKKIKDLHVWLRMT